MAHRGLGLWRRIAVMLVLPVVSFWTRPTWTGTLPASGGIIIAANHISHFDPLTLAHFVYRAGRWPRFLGKASLWRIPVIGFLLRKTQQIPVERGSVEAVKSLDALIDALRCGGAVIIYPEGTTTREPDLWPMHGKTGAAPSRAVLDEITDTILLDVRGLLAGIRGETPPAELFEPPPDPDRPADAARPEAGR